MCCSCLHRTQSTTSSLQAAIWPIIANKEALAVNQAWYGFSGSQFFTNATVTYLYKPVSATSVAVLLMNNLAGPATLTLTFANIPKVPAPGPNGYKVRSSCRRAILTQRTMQ